MHLKKVKRRFWRLRAEGAAPIKHNGSEWLLLANGGLQNRVEKRELNDFMRLFTTSKVNIVQPHNVSYAYCRLDQAQSRAIVSSTQTVRWFIRGLILVLKFLILILKDFKGEPVNLIGYHMARPGDESPVSARLPRGIRIEHEFITEQLERELVEELNRHHFRRYNHRSMLQFGRIIDFTKLSISADYVDTPDLIKRVQERIEAITEEAYDQVTCNHYRVGDCIPFHVDHAQLYGHSGRCDACGSSKVRS